MPIMIAPIAVDTISDTRETDRTPSLLSIDSVSKSQDQEDDGDEEELFRIDYPKMKHPSKKDSEKRASGIHGKVLSESSTADNHEAETVVDETTPGDQSSDTKSLGSTSFREYYPLDVCENKRSKMDTGTTTDHHVAKSMANKSIDGENLTNNGGICCSEKSRRKSLNQKEQHDDDKGVAIVADQDSSSNNPSDVTCDIDCQEEHESQQQQQENLNLSQYSLNNQCSSCCNTPPASYPSGPCTCCCCCCCGPAASSVTDLEGQEIDVVSSGRVEQTTTNDVNVCGSVLTSEANNKIQKND